MSAGGLSLPWEGTVGAWRPAQSTSPRAADRHHWALADGAQVRAALCVPKPGARIHPTSLESGWILPDRQGQPGRMWPGKYSQSDFLFS